ncbi:MAG: RND family efflux transporter MFP subunit [Flavobacteriales bacterium]|jgi:RND family efflux transporter MFP subunit
MSPKTKRIVYPSFAIVIAAIIVSILMLTKAEPERKPLVKAVPLVEVSPVTVGDIQISVTSQGLVEAKFKTELVSKVSGEVVFLSEAFVRGGLINKGEVLLQVDPFDYEVRLEQARATLASARASFILERAQGQVAEAEWKQITNAKPSELGLRKPQQERALADVKAAEAGVKMASKELERTKIVAPFNALIGERSVSLGSFVNIGTNLGQVLDTSIAQVRLPVASTDLKYLEQGGTGAKVIVYGTAGGYAYEWQGSIARDEGVINNNNRMLFLVAELKDPYKHDASNNAPRLPFGSYITADIMGLMLSNATRVPRHLLSEGRLPLYVDGKLELKPVSVLRHEGKLSVIEAGLETDDKLISSSLPQAVDGMSLRLYSAEREPVKAVASPEPEEANIDKET